MEPREDTDSSENLQEVERRYDELDRLTGKHEATAHEQSEILERKHTMTAAATYDEAETLEQQHATRETAAATHVAEIFEQKHAATTAAITNEETEILEQPMGVTATRKEETVDGKDQELSALTERPKNMDRKGKAQVRDISNKIKQGIRDNKRSKRHDNIQVQTRKKKVLITHMRNKSGNIRGILQRFILK